MTNMEQRMMHIRSAHVDLYRPAFHFTARRNWINDPNGLVYFEGEYHLFFQYNPHGKNWGHMSWGHAVSSDLVNWRELPVAMPEREFMIFSGSVVVDWHNSSGLGDGASPPLVALYTAFHQAPERQSQHVAYSHDRGRTWTEYSGNPVICLGVEHFRDPKVFWHAPTNAWIMVVALPREHQILVYRSADLVAWELASTFGSAGSTSGQWECPDLFEVPVENSAETMWVLKIDVDQGLIAGGSGAQWFAGIFDGYRFTQVQPREDSVVQLVDCGPDFYAAQTWSDLPEGRGGPIWIGWMSNHQSGKEYPTHPWRGAMTMSRHVFLRKENGGLQLCQRPVSHVTPCDHPRPPVDQTWLRGPQQLRLDAQGTPFIGEIAFRIGKESSGSLLFTVTGEHNTGIRVELDLRKGELRLQRQAHPDIRAAAFVAESIVSLPDGESIDVRILKDHSSIELFLGGGSVVATACFFALGVPQAVLSVDARSDILLTGLSLANPSVTGEDRFTSTLRR